MPAKKAAKKVEATSEVEAEPTPAPSSPAKPAAKAAKATKATKAATSAPAPAAEATDEEPAEESPEVEHVPLNRAERRAKGKGGAAPQPTSRGKVVGGKGPASTQRMWANRRSG